MVGEYLQKQQTGKNIKQLKKTFIKHIQISGLGQLTIKGLAKKINKEENNLIWP